MSEDGIATIAMPSFIERRSGAGPASVRRGVPSSRCCQSGSLIASDGPRDNVLYACESVLASLAAAGFCRFPPCPPVLSLRRRSGAVGI